MSVTSLEGRVLALEQSCDQHREMAVEPQLHLEDIEDRSRRNNLWLRGIPKSVGAEDLGEAVVGIFRVVFEEPEAIVLLDRAHRTLGPRSDDPNRPRDVVCQLHRYTQKENILHRTWDREAIEVGGSQVKILPVLSRATLKRRAFLRPLLDMLHQKDLTYR